ncbi:FxsA family protein [Halodesulfovibrio spirochaetisodalis]|uniref:Uncharacterized protein n=1 Tax=Halodesulfovibrio spirochaetisodalis TaxID=1560234 RepID=A0A1B7XFK9_9BACT|nr:FxsA family protein [Halodesulfovibrio spirochaetisodalis]OBQ54038.1 hypothetical protein SP90_06050 [Halodesulfovibrio spirochaetisodalis]
MKPILTEAELRFLLTKKEISETQLRQVERLEMCASVLRALRVLYPEKVQTYIALFIFFSILNPLEHKLITPLNPQMLLLSVTLLTNCIGLVVLKTNGAEWITTSLTSVQTGMLPPASACRSAIITLAASLFLLPGIVFSIMATILIVPPVTTLLANTLHQHLLGKFE